MSESFVPGARGALIPGKAGRLFSYTYTPGGSGKMPVVILCHGFPGKERIMDLAVYLREQGFCAVTFHYRGSWGSDGSYTLPGCMDDAESVLDWVLSDPFGCFDTSSIFFLGHSWGGCITSRILAVRPEVRAGVMLMPADMTYLMTELYNDPEGHDMIHNAFSEGCEWLKDYSIGQMLDEVKAEPERYSMPAYAPAIAGKPVFVAGGLLDTLISIEGNVRPLAEALAKNPGPAPVVRYYETDHGMNLHREEIRHDVASFLRSCL